MGNSAPSIVVSGGRRVSPDTAAEAIRQVMLGRTIAEAAEASGAPRDWVQRNLGHLSGRGRRTVQHGLRVHLFAAREAAARLTAERWQPGAAEVARLLDRAISWSEELVWLLENDL